MNQDDEEYLKRVGTLLGIATELAGDAVLLLGATGRMVDAS